MVEKGKLVKVSYDGYVDDKLFDTTNEEKAKEAGIYNPKIVYGPVAIFAGEGQILPGLDEVILEMNVGEEREVILPPEKAFGKRDPSKIKIIPLSEFKKRGLTPFKGMVITVDGLTGRVVSINSGRVLVDFNHELAGKEVKYRIKIEEIIENKEDIIKEIVKMAAPRVVSTVKIEDNTVIIEIPPLDPRIKLAIVQEIFKRFDDIDEVKFIETFKKKKEEKKEENKEQ